MPAKWKPLVNISGLLSRLSVSISRNPLPGFDPIFYRYWYRDIGAFGGGPLLHYLQFGWKEGRDPSAGFSSDGYLAANPDVAALNVNPLMHFLENGLAEGRTGWQKDPRLPPAPARLVNAPLKLLAPPSSERSSQ